MDSQKKNEFVILKAIGIILVVVGHKGGISLFEDWFPIYSFHMPLFLFISGYFYKNSNEENLKAFLIKKFKTLLIPYFIWNLIYGIIVNILKVLGVANFGERINFHSLFIEPWVKGHQFGLNIASWFILSLFLVQVIYTISRTILNHYKIKNEYIIMLMFFALGVFAIFIANRGNVEGLKLVVVRNTFLLTFYSLGVFYNRKIEKYDKLDNLSYFMIVFAIQFILLFKYETLGFSVAFCDDFNRENILLPFMTSITGIMFWLRISKALVKSLGESKLIKYIGDNSWTIMMHHQFIFYIITSTFAVLSLILKWDDFNWIVYSNDPWYAYIRGPENILLLYVIAGIAVPLTIKYYIDKTKLNKNNHTAF